MSRYYDTPDMENNGKTISLNKAGCLLVAAALAVFGTALAVKGCHAKAVKPQQSEAPNQPQKTR